mgnify:CR=1 FL=1
MSVSKLQQDFGEQNYYSSGFQNVIESHLQYLKGNAKYVNSPVSGLNGLKYQGDFFGLLIELKVPAHFHWIAMRLNDLHSPMDYDGKMESVLIPDTQQLEFLLRKWVNTSARV